MTHKKRWLLISVRVVRTHLAANKEQGPSYRKISAFISASGIKTATGKCWSETGACARAVIKRTDQRKVRLEQRNFSTELQIPNFIISSESWKIHNHKQFCHRDRGILRGTSKDTGQAKPVLVAQISSSIALLLCLCWLVGRDKRGSIDILFSFLL